MMLSQITSVPVLLLGASAGVAILTGGLADAAVILAVVVVNAGIGFITESYAENTINALTHVTSGNAAVVRDATVQIIAAELVVPGDILVLWPGNRVARPRCASGAHPGLFGRRIDADGGEFFRSSNRPR